MHLSFKYARISEICFYCPAIIRFSLQESYSEFSLRFQMQDLVNFFFVMTFMNMQSKKWAVLQSLTSLRSRQSWTLGCPIKWSGRRIANDSRGNDVLRWWGRLFHWHLSCGCSGAAVPLSAAWWSVVERMLGCGRVAIRLAIRVKSPYRIV